ncbi:MAG: hypothetical protein J6B07_01030 [Opitutales bacterium]|nr:hypothetical protein [Opitutales bacterium]
MKYVLSVVLFALSLWFGFDGINQNLQKRAIHADESEQATTFLKLYKDGEYKYNPNGPHGPTLYYWANWAEKTSYKTPAKEIEVQHLRKLMLPMSIIAIIAILSVAGQIGLCAGLCSASIFISTSLAQIYGTYFIQEIIFALSIFLTTLTSLLFVRNQSVLNAILLGISAGFAQASKETSVIAFASIGLSLITLATTNDIFRNSCKNIFSKKTLVNISICAICFVCISAIWYSSFGSNIQGCIDAIKSYFIHFFDKAQMSEHHAESLYYIKLLFVQKSQGVFFGEILFTALAIIGFILSIINLRSKKNEINGALTSLYFGLCSIFTILILSFITYKTPWLLLSPIMLMCVPAGYFVSKIFSMRIIYSLPIVTLIIVCYVYLQNPITTNAVKRFHSDPRNPFIYSHTVSDEKNLVSRIFECAKFSDYKEEIPIAFVGKISPWPLPWQLRNFTNVGYWKNTPSNINDFEVIIVDTFLANELDKKIDKSKYVSDFFGIRNNTILTIYIKDKIFKKIIEQ